MIRSFRIKFRSTRTKLEYEMVSFNINISNYGRPCDIIMLFPLIIAYQFFVNIFLYISWSQRIFHLMYTLVHWDEFDGQLFIIQIFTYLNIWIFSSKRLSLASIRGYQGPWKEICSHIYTSVGRQYWSAYDFITQCGQKKHRIFFPLLTFECSLSYYRIDNYDILRC